MSSATAELKHPYIVSHPDYCGGSPVIIGTKFPVRSVVNYVIKQGITPEELVNEFKHLNLAQIYDALSYYYDHQARIDREIDDNREQSQQSG